VPLLGTNLSAGRCAIVEGTQRQTGYGGLSLTIRVQVVIKVRLAPVSALSATARAAKSY
jgi:hypothetical protein